MRVVLVSLIVLTQVAGPWLCCCAVAQVSAAMSGTLQAKPADTVPVQPKPPICPHCKGEPQPAGTPSEPTPASPLPEQCPCGGYELVAVPIERKATTDEATSFVAEPFALPAPFPPVLSQAVAERPGLRELPWMTTSDRLFAHHVLRC